MKTVTVPLEGKKEEIVRCDDTAGKIERELRDGCCLVVVVPHSA